MNANLYKDDKKFAAGCNTNKKVPIFVKSIIL